MEASIGEIVVKRGLSSSIEIAEKVKTVESRCSESIRQETGLDDCMKDTNSINGRIDTRTEESVQIECPMFIGYVLHEN